MSPRYYVELEFDNDIANEKDMIRYIEWIFQNDPKLKNKRVKKIHTKVSPFARDLHFDAGTDKSSYKTRI